MGYTDRDAQRKYNRDYYYRRKATSEGSKKIRLKTDEKKLLVPIRMPASLAGRLQRMVVEANATGAFPWRNMTQTITALIVKGLDTLKDDPFIAHQLEYLNTLEDIKEIGERRLEAQAALSRIRIELNEMLAIKALDEATKCYANFHDRVEDMSQDVWRDWLLRSLEKAFPRLHNNIEHVVRHMEFGRKAERRAAERRGTLRGDSPTTTATEESEADADDHRNRKPRRAHR